MNDRASCIRDHNGEKQQVLAKVSCVGAMILFNVEQESLKEKMDGFALHLEVQHWGQSGNKKISVLTTLKTPLQAATAGPCTSLVLSSRASYPHDHHREPSTHNEAGMKKDMLHYASRAG